MNIFSTPHAAVTAATPPTSKQTAVRSQDFPANSTDDMLTSEGAGGSPRPSSSTQSEGAPFGCGCSKCIFVFLRMD